VCVWSLQREVLSLEKLLKQFVTLESVDDVTCDTCQRSVSFVKKLSIGKARNSLSVTCSLPDNYYVLATLF